MGSMEEKIKIDSLYCASEDIVAREIEGELIIIPISSGIGDAEDDMYSFNETGQLIWELLNGENTVSQIIEQLDQKHEASENEIKDDVLGLLNELLKRGIIVKINKN